MHKIQRHEQILRFLNIEGFANVEQLTDLLETSPATIRRDLIELETSRQLIRVHGGIKPAGAPASGLRGSTLEQNLTQQLAQKRAIGKAAAQLCRDNESIIINGGSTTFQMCPHLTRNVLQILTNSLPIATELLNHSSHRIYLCGGELYREQEVVLNPYSDATASHFFADKLFLGTQSITQRGLLETDGRLIRAEQELLQQAEQVVLLADSSKFHRKGNLLLCALERVHLVITDDGITDDSLQMLEHHGVKCIAVAAGMPATSVVATSVVKDGSDKRILRGEKTRHAP